MADGHYSKLYHVLADEYPDIYEDDRVLGCYARLLMAADAAWPLRPYVPARVHRQSLAELVKAGLVILHRDRFTVMGLDKERNARSTAGRNAARIRWGNANGNAEVMPSRAKQSRAEGIQGANPLEGRDVDARVDP